jgi:L-serine dehydratase
VFFQLDAAETEHPNTVKIELFDEDKKLEIVGVSIGGGSIEIIEINGFGLRLSGDRAILVLHHDRYGVVSSVTTVLSTHKVNISHMEVSRKQKGDQAIMVIEVDEKIEDSVKEEVKKLEHVINVIAIVE